jgi:hypothetical protein
MVVQYNSMRVFESLFMKTTKRGSKKLLIKLQKYQTDPVGIGTLVRNRLSYERWNKMKGNEIYSSLNLKVKVKIDLFNTGNQNEFRND